MVIAFFIFIVLIGFAVAASSTETVGRKDGTTGNRIIASRLLIGLLLFGPGIFGLATAAGASDLVAFIITTTAIAAVGWGATRLLYGLLYGLLAALILFVFGLLFAHTPVGEWIQDAVVAFIDSVSRYGGMVGNQLN